MLVTAKIYMGKNASNTNPAESKARNDVVICVQNRAKKNMFPLPSIRSKARTNK